MGTIASVARILLLHYGVYGQTRKICERMQAELAALGAHADVIALADGNVDPSTYDAIVIGASIRNGKHNPAVMDFIRLRRDLLEAKPSAFFSVNLVARKPAKNTPETNPYVRAFLARCPWTPRLVGVFGGDLDYPRYKAMDRNIIRFIMWLTHGPTDLQSVVEFTNWEDVEVFGRRVCEME